MKPGDISELVSKYWELSPELGAKVVEDEVLFQRGWFWPTEGDAAAITQISKFMVEGKLIPKPLTWDQVKSAFAKAAPFCRRPTRQRASCPPRRTSPAKDAKDLRGLPAWEMNSWKAPA